MPVELHLTFDELLDLARDPRTPEDVCGRATEALGNCAEQAPAAGGRAMRKELLRIYERRLRREAAGIDRTAGAAELIDQLRTIDDGEILVYALDYEGLVANFFAVGAPSWLVGFVLKK